MNTKSEYYITPPANFIFASMLLSYPSEDFAESTAILLNDQDLLFPQSLKNKIKSLVENEDGVDLLCSTYIDIFDRGRESNPIYETEYGRNRYMSKAAELADISGFYKAFGLELGSDPSCHDMLDHAGIELEFYALLLLKQGILEEQADQEGSEIVLDARRKFLADHLGRFLPAMSERPGIKTSEFYSEAVGWSRDIVRKECEMLGVKPVEVGWASDQTEKENLECGATCTVK